MMYSILVDHLVGMTSEEIAARWKQLNSAADANIEAVANNRRRVVEHVIGKAHEHARKGDLAAIAWLEDLDLIVLPSKGCGVPEEKRKPALDILKAIFRNAGQGDLDAGDMAGSTRPDGISGRAAG